MQETAAQPTASESSNVEETPLRVVLVGDREAFGYYGTALRIMAVGLIDEMADVTVVSLGYSRQIDYIPCPPVRIITELRGYHNQHQHYDATSREVCVRASRGELVNWLLPHRRIRRLSESLRPFKPTLLHALTESQAPLVRRISKYLHLPYVVTSFGGEQNLVSVSHARCGGIFCCDSGRARYLRTQYPDLADRICRLALGAHVSEHRVGNEDRTLRTIAYFGPLVQGQGLAHLINAIRLLKDEGLAVVLMLYGQGRYEHELREQVRLLHLHNEVHFVPPVETFMSGSDANKHILRETDILVQTGSSQTRQIVILEAMSVGTVVISTHTSENDLILAGKNAAVVPFQDTEELAKALGYLLRNPQAAQRQADEARDYLKKHYRPSQMISQLVQGYRKALALVSESRGKHG